MGVGGVDGYRRPGFCVAERLAQRPLVAEDVESGLGGVGGLGVPLADSAAEDGFLAVAVDDQEGDRQSLRRRCQEAAGRQAEQRGDEWAGYDGSTWISLTSCRWPSTEDAATCAICLW